MSDCIHGLPADQCATCSREVLGDEHKPPIGARTTASYKGRCPLCDDAIHVGDGIKLTTNGWAHEDCDE